MNFRSLSVHNWNKLQVLPFLNMNLERGEDILVIFTLYPAIPLEERNILRPLESLRKVFKGSDNVQDVKNELYKIVDCKKIVIYSLYTS